MIRPSLVLFTLLATVMWCSGGGKANKLHLITLHLEAEETDNPKMITPVKLGSEHRQYYFGKIPSFTDKDIKWFYPFTAQDGVSYGAAFKLTDHASSQLKDLTITNQGKLLGLRCSDAPLQAVLIDRPVDDGVVVVWEGLQQRHLKEFRKRFPHIDETAPPEAPQFAVPGR